MRLRSDEGVLITGVYGAGKSTVAAEISYLLEQRRPPYALPDLDFHPAAMARTVDSISERNRHAEARHRCPKCHADHFTQHPSR
jgi:adenylylsulfate kinase-like enzyme